MKQGKVRGLLGGIAFAAALVAAPAFADDTAFAGSAETYAELNALYEKAKAAGQKEVVIYGAYSVAFAPVWELFHNRYEGISVVGNPLRGSELMARIDAEVASGQHVGDMVMAGQTELITIASTEAGLAWQPINIGAIPATLHDPEGKFVLNFADAVGMVYNKKAMPEAELPKSLEDLKDPKYKGMVFDDPAGNAITTMSWTELYAAGKIDADFMKAVVANGNVVPSVTPLFNNITTGSVALMPWAAYSRYLRLEGAGAEDVGFATIPGFIIPLNAGTVILDGAPNEDAVKLLQTWMLTPEAQAALAEFGFVYPLVPGTPTPEGWMDFAAITEALPPVAPGDYLAAKKSLLDAVKAALK